MCDASSAKIKKKKKKQLYQTSDEMLGVPRQRVSISNQTNCKDRIGAVVHVVWHTKLNCSNGGERGQTMPWYTGL